MASIKIDAEKIDCIEFNEDDDGGTIIIAKNGHYIFVDKNWTILTKESKDGALILIEL